MMPELYFTQIEPPSVESIAALSEHWMVHHLPFFEMVYLDEAPHTLDTDIIIITSGYAARWLARFVQPGTPVATVGKTTSQRLVEAGHRLLYDQPPGNAGELIALLKARIQVHTRLLYLRGNRTTGRIEDAFAKHPGYQQEIVYQTKPLKPRQAPKAGAMVYFQSPSAVEAYSQHFRHAPQRVAVIGPTTASAVRALGWHIDFQPSRPETSAFIDEINQWQVRLTQDKIKG